LVGIAWSVDDGQAVITLVNHFGDDAAAAAQIEPLRTLFEQGETSRTSQPFASMYALESVEAEGPVTITTLRLADDGRAATAFQMLHRLEVPFG